MTATERSELQGLVAASTQMLRGMLFIVVLGLFGFLVRAIQLRADVSFPYWAILSAALGLWLYRKSKAWTGGPEFRRQVREDLHSGETRVVSIIVQRAVEFEEAEDEGPSFLIETMDGDSILFTGQHLDSAKRRGFPWQEIEIHEAPNSQYFFRIKGHGESISVDSIRPSLEYALLQSLGCFQHNYVQLDPAQRAKVVGD